MTDKEKALQNILSLTSSDCQYREAQAQRLAMMWPSLAVAFAELLAAHELPVPPAFRAAARVVQGELIDNRAVAGMGSCRTCGHVQHQHTERGCGQCTVCQGFVSLRPVQPLQNGAWCFCAAGSNAGGRGHLRSEEKCERTSAPDGHHMDPEPYWGST